MKSSSKKTETHAKMNFFVVDYYLTSYLL